MSSTTLDILALHSLGLRARYLMQNYASNLNETLLPTYSAWLLCRPSPRQPRHRQTASQLQREILPLSPAQRARRHNNVHSAPSQCPYTWSFRRHVMKREAGPPPLCHFLCCCVWGCLRVGRAASSCSRDLQVSFHRVLSYSL